MGTNSTLENYHLAITFMKENLQRKLTVADVARYCHVSVSGLEKIFAKYFGGGIMQFFLEMKLEYSKKLLAQGHNNHEISTMLSFSSPAHFSGTFKKKFGISPLQYKEKVRKEEARMREVAFFDFGHESVLRMSKEQAECAMMLLEAKKYIEENYEDSNLEVSAIAQILESKKYEHASYLLQPEIKQMLKNYISDVRIERCKTLLTQTDFTIAEVAQKCGFSGVSGFCRAFKEITDTSPSEFRIISKK